MNELAELVELMHWTQFTDDQVLAGVLLKRRLKRLLQS